MYTEADIAALLHRFTDFPASILREIHGWP
jgi:hypothetical protein